MLCVTGHKDDVFVDSKIFQKQASNPLPPNNNKTKTRKQTPTNKVFKITTDERHIVRIDILGRYLGS